MITPASHGSDRISDYLTPSGATNIGRRLLQTAGSCAANQVFVNSTCLCNNGFSETGVSFFGLSCTCPVNTGINLARACSTYGNRIPACPVKQSGPVGTNYANCANTGAQAIYGNNDIASLCNSVEMEPLSSASAEGGPRGSSSSQGTAQGGGGRSRKSLWGEAGRGSRERDGHVTNLQDSFMGFYKVH